MVDCSKIPNSSLRQVPNDLLFLVQKFSVPTSEVVGGVIQWIPKTVKNKYYVIAAKKRAIVSKERLKSIAVSSEVKILQSFL